MSDAQLPYMIAGILVFAFILVIVALMFSRKILGWPRLELLFPDRPDDPTVARYHIQSLFVSKPGKSLPGPYIQGFVSLIACETGLRILLWPVFRPFFKPIFMPWEEITTVTVTMKVTRIKGLGLKVGPGVPYTLTIIARVGRMISEKMNGKLEIPPELQR